MNPRIRTAAAAFVGLLVALLSTGGPSQADGSRGDPRVPPSVTKIDASPIARYAGDHTIVIDASGGFAAVDRLLKGKDNALEGWTIRIAGLPRATPAQIRRGDRRLMRNDAKVPPPRCPSQPESPRLTHGRTAAYLGCDEATGQERRGSEISAPADVGLKKAVEQVLHRAFPDVGRWGAIDVEVNQRGEARVSLPAEFGEVMAGALPDEQYAMYRDLLFTAYSNAELTSVGYTITGDCLAYAVAVGGDTCATTTF